MNTHLYNQNRYVLIYLLLGKFMVNEAKILVLIVTCESTLESLF